MQCWLFVVFLYLCMDIVRNQSTNCTTPNGEIATCVSLFSCPILQKAFDSDKPSDKIFVEDSVCPEGVLMVCCGTFDSYVTNRGPSSKPLNQTPNNGTTLEETYRQYVIDHLLPNKTFCGKQHTDDYFYNDTNTSVDEFPWLVYIPQFSQQYDREHNFRTESNCVGVLINSFYVLTDEDCYYKDKLDTVSLGQHHIYKNRSCVATPYGQDDCSSVQNIPIDTVHVKHFQLTNFILLRLKKKVNFDDYIRPICIPLLESDMLKPDKTVVTSGWGEAEYVNGNYVKIKKRISHTVLSRDECLKGNVISNPICAVNLNEDNSYVCPSDIGGPIMYKYKKNWFLGGVITKLESCAFSEPIVGERFGSRTLKLVLGAIKP